MMVTAVAVAARVVLAVVLATTIASAASASSAGPVKREGRPPAPARGGVAPIFQGKFTNPLWGGSIVLALTPDGRTVMNVGGIAPGVCEDKDFGHLVAGRDGATGPTFDILLPARISANGSFAHSESHQGQRIPFKPAVSATISGTFDGETVHGKLRASRTTTFDTCRANVSFKARRIQ
jgi:hypothetical protein